MLGSMVINTGGNGYISCVAVITNFCIKFCHNDASDTTLYRRYFIHSRAGVSSLPFLVSARCVRIIFSMRLSRFYFDQAAASGHNSRMVITLAKFLHIGPSSGSVEFEYVQYMVSGFL